MRKLALVLFISLLVVVFFWQFFIKGLLPIPSDTIIGLYHPFRDLYAKDYPNGIPFKNFLITDPVRQQYPWRELVISLEKKLQLPLWNPYNFSGTPLLANFQSAPFYFFNILFFIIPFTTSWSLIVFLGPLLGAIFLFIYLQNLKLSKQASLLGSISYAFSGFFVAWMEWGTITHVALWLPLILLSVDKIFAYPTTKKISNIKYQMSSIHIKNKKFLFWSFVFIFSLTSSFLAGHLQIFFYVLIFSTAYIISRWFQYGRIFNFLYVFLIFYILFFILTSVQWIPTLQFISLSARNVDVIDLNNSGWFIPWQHLIQFIAPDFFGNPTTLNYWGIWNYGEFIGYVGLAPLIFALFSLFFRRDKKTLFFGTVLFVSLIFSLPTFFAKIPFDLNIPFMNTAQPTRLLFLVTFSLTVLSALGFDYFIKNKKKEIFFSLGFVSIIFILLWLFVVSLGTTLSINLEVSKRNLLLPTILLVVFWLLISCYAFLKKQKALLTVIPLIIIGVVVFDLFRFGWKFEPFTQKAYLFPSTLAISFLQKNIGEFRMMSTDARILPPNFSSIYRIQNIDGYDPLYLLRYGELIAASERKKADINPPFGFNRIITPHNIDSKIIDLLGVKYVLSLSDLNSTKLKKVFQEGETRIYENKNVLRRAFFVEQVLYEKDKTQVMNALFRDDIDLSKVAILQLPYHKENAKTASAIGQLDNKRTVGKATITSYSENRVIIEVENTSDAGVLILTDTYYPTWRAKVNNDYEIPILQVDYNFRGINVPKGKHKIEFYTTLL